MKPARISEKICPDTIATIQSLVYFTFKILKTLTFLTRNYCIFRKTGYTVKWLIWFIPTTTRSCGINSVGAKSLPANSWISKLVNFAKQKMRIQKYAFQEQWRKTTPLRESTWAVDGGSSFECGLDRLSRCIDWETEGLFSSMEVGNFECLTFKTFLWRRISYSNPECVVFRNYFPTWKPWCKYLSKKKSMEKREGYLQSEILYKKSQRGNTFHQYYFPKETSSSSSCRSQLRGYALYRLYQECRPCGHRRTDFLLPGCDRPAASGQHAALRRSHHYKAILCQNRRGWKDDVRWS